MKLTRRNFLAWAGLSAVGAVACEGFGIREGELSIQSSTMLPEDLVGPLVFLCSDDAGMITGHTLIVDGGQIFV